MAAQLIKTLKLTNFTELYSLTNKKNYDTDNLTQHHLLYKQFLAWSCNGLSVAPVSHYVDNPIFQELPDQEKYFSAKSERIYLELWIRKRSWKTREKRLENKPADHSKKCSSFQSKSKNLGVLTLRVFICFIKKRSNFKT